MGQLDWHAIACERAMDAVLEMTKTPPESFLSKCNAAMISNSITSAIPQENKLTKKMLEDLMDNLFLAQGRALPHVFYPRKMEMALVREEQVCFGGKVTGKRITYRTPKPHGLETLNVQVPSPTEFTVYTVSAHADPMLPFVLELRPHYGDGIFPQVGAAKNLRTNTLDRVELHAAWAKYVPSLEHREAFMILAAALDVYNKENTNVHVD